MRKIHTLRSLIALASLLLSFGFSSKAMGLEIDETLTLRVVKTSDSRKTILINRGSEDGLVKGDHARFYLSVGVVARGVAIQIAPSRSVWSLYRLVNADYVRDDQVMKLKITAPVKITTDESRSLVGDDTAVQTTRDPRDLGIPLAAGAEDLELDLEGEPVSSRSQGLESDLFFNTSLDNKNREVFGAFSYESLSSESTAENATASGANSMMLLEAGFEYYFSDKSKWYSRVSLLGTFRTARASVMGYEGTEVKQDASFFGAGVNWYPLARPDNIHRFIPFGQFMYHMGSVSSSVNAQGASPFEADLSGSATMLTFGFGFKYFIPNGWGASAKLEYESRVDDFSAEEGTERLWQTVSSGPRIVGGVSYRF